MTLSLRRGSVLCLAVALAGCPPKQPKPTAAGAAQQTEAEVVAAPPRTPEDRLTEALDLLGRGSKADAQVALSLLDELLRERPDWSVARYNLGVAKFQLGDYREAIRAFEDCLDADPKLSVAWASIARVHEAAGRSDKALLVWRDAIEADPEDMDIRLGLVAALRAQGRNEDAVAAAKAALSVNNNSLPIYDEMGQAYFALGDLTLAEFVFDKARVVFKEAEQNPPLLTHLALVWQQKKNLPEATYFLEKALAIDGKYIPALISLSRIRMDQHDWAGAVSLLEVAEPLVPEDALLQLDLGVALRGVGRFEDAERHYRRALELAPDDAAPWLNLGILFGDYQKRYPEALTALQKYVDMNGPDAAVAKTYIGDLEKEQKKAEKRKKQEEERKAREAERLERQRLLEEAAAADAAAAAAAAASAPPSETPPSETAPSDAPPLDAPATPPGEALPDAGSEGEGSPPASGSAEPAPAPEAPGTAEQPAAEPGSSPWDTPQGVGG
jgi:tetratricopeptide (TPR) repeat protein